jgi:hypothetical protein
MGSREALVCSALGPVYYRKISAVVITSAVKMKRSSAVI